MNGARGSVGQDAILRGDCQSPTDRSLTVASLNAFRSRDRQGAVGRRHFGTSLKCA